MTAPRDMIWETTCDKFDDLVRTTSLIRDIHQFSCDRQRDSRIWKASGNSGKIPFQHLESNLAIVTGLSIQVGIDGM